MSDEAASSAALPNTPTSNEPAPDAGGGGKPSLEQAFAGGGKSKLSSNLTRPKKLGSSAFSEGENELVGKSKKAKSALPKEREDEGVSFDKPPAEKPEELRESKPQAPKEAPKPEPKVEPKLEAKPEEKQAPRMHKVKVDGVEIEVDEETMKRDYQIRKASDKVFQEASKMRKEAENIFRGLKDRNQIASILQAHGHDPRQLAEEFLSSALQFEMMTPEQQEIVRLRSEKAQRDYEADQRFKHMEAERLERDRKGRADAMQQSIIQTLEKTPDLPKDTGTVRKIIEQMRIRIKGQAHLPEHLREDVTPESVMSDVRASIERDIRTKVSQLTPQQLATFLGKEKLDEYRKWELSQIKNPIGKAAEPVENVDFQPQKKRHFKTMDDFKANQAANGVKTFGGRF